MLTIHFFKTLFYVEHSQNKKMQDRIKRALAQNMYLIERCDSNVFQIAGITKNYRVIIAEKNGHHCTCPDYDRRREPCKHIFFVLFRVFKLDPESWVSNPSLMPDLEFAVSIRKLETEDTECPICYEEFTNQSITETCRCCLHKFDVDCMTVWRSHSLNRKCPLCRQ
jgi:hypothetical protein